MAILKDCLAQKLDQCLAAKCDGFRREWFFGKNQAPYRSAEKEKNVGSVSDQLDLQPVSLNEFAAGDAFADHGAKHDDHRLKGLLRDDRHGVGFAFVKANHLLLHEALKLALREDAVEMVEGDPQDALAGTDFAKENFERAVANLAGNHLKRGNVQFFFAFEVVIKQRLVDGGRRGDLVHSGAGKSVGAEFAECGIEDAGASFSRPVGA